jgi:hypothetical protein
MRRRPPRDVRPLLDLIGVIDVHLVADPDTLGRDRSVGITRTDAAKGGLAVEGMHCGQNGHILGLQNRWITSILVRFGNLGDGQRIDFER